MALPRWARPYRKRPTHLTAWEWKLRLRVFTPLWLLFGVPFYASLGILALASPGVVIALVGWAVNPNPMPPGTPSLLMVPTTIFIVMGTITCFLRWYFVHS